MKKVIFYEAPDGARFDSKYECAEYEAKHSLYARFVGIPFYDSAYTNISEMLLDSPISFVCHLYAFKANDARDIRRIKYLFDYLGLSTNGIDSPGEYHLSMYEVGWEKG